MIRYYGILLIISITTFSCNNNNEVNIEPGSHAKIVYASDINKKIKNGEDIVLNNATIIGDIFFTLSNDKNILSPGLFKHYVSSSVSINDCTFKGKVRAFGKQKDYDEVVRFRKNVCFYNCIFQDTVDFSYAEFTDLTSFSGSQFQKFTSFKSVHSSGNGFIFNKTLFTEYAKFNIMKSDDKCDFSDAVFEKNVLFQSSVFNNQARFASVKFNENAIFTNVKFKDDVFFNYSDFKKNIKFNNTLFKGRTEFIKCKFNYISEFKNCTFFYETKFSNSELTGILTFENSNFYLSNPENFNIKINNESDFLINNINVLKKIN